MRIIEQREVQLGTANAQLREPVPSDADFVEILRDGGRPFLIEMSGGDFLLEVGAFLPIPQHDNEIGISELLTPDGISLARGLPSTASVKLAFMDAETAGIRSAAGSSRGQRTHTRTTQVSFPTATDEWVSRSAGSLRLTVKNSSGTTFNLSHNSAAPGGDFMTLPTGASVVWFGPLRAYQASGGALSLELIEEIHAL